MFSVQNPTLRVPKLTFNTRGKRQTEASRLRHLLNCKCALTRALCEVPAGLEGVLQGAFNLGESGLRKSLLCLPISLPSPHPPLPGLSSAWCLPACTQPSLHRLTLCSSVPDPSGDSAPLASSTPGPHPTPAQHVLLPGAT